MFVIVWRKAKHWWKRFRRLVCCGSIHTPEARNVNMRVCRHHTTWGGSEQTKHFSSASVRGLFSQTGTDWTASYFTGLSWFPTSRDGWQAQARAPNTTTLPWKLFRKTLQPLLKDGVGVERAAFVARQLCQCFTVCSLAAVDFFSLCDWGKQAYHSFSWMTESIHHLAFSSCQRT